MHPHEVEDLAGNLNHLIWRKPDKIISEDGQLIVKD